MTIKEKVEKYLSNYDNGFNHRNAIRWLYKREPKLWPEILNATSFLEKDAKPKQRVWHILNEVYTVPLCPTDNIPVKWHENRYLKYSSQSAKARDPENTKLRMEAYRERTGEKHWMSGNTPKNKASREKMTKTRAKGNYPSPWSDPKVRSKCRETLFKKYGVINPGQLEYVKKMNSNPDKTERELYYEEVTKYTKLNWLSNFDDINPNRITRGPEQHLDHIYSILEGYKNNIPPEIIGHWTNLQMLPRRENFIKRDKCWKTQEQLYEDYKAAK